VAGPVVDAVAGLGRSVAVAGPERVAVAGAGLVAVPVDPAGQAGVVAVADPVALVRERDWRLAHWRSWGAGAGPALEQGAARVAGPEQGAAEQSAPEARSRLEGPQIARQILIVSRSA
jgi:hypothetical protein